MPQLTVRKVDASLVRALKERAARHGRSAEAEHRIILEEALGRDDARTSFKEFILSMPDVGEDADFARVEGTIREVEL